MVVVKFKRFRPEARIPEYAHPTDTGADLRFCEEAAGINLWAGETRVCWTGIGIELPPGWEAQIRPRSSLSSKGILVAFGSVDEGYRGQLGVTITNTTREQYVLRKGDKIAQLVVCPRHTATFEEVDELGKSERAGGGFGSTGT